MDSFDARGLVVFSLPISDFVKFAGYLLVRLEDGTTYLSKDKLTWIPFEFDIQEAKRG